MKIKLKSLGLPSTTGILLQSYAPANSSTDYQDDSDGIEVSELYFQDKTGVLDGVRLGVEHNIWVPVCAIENQIEPVRGDKIIIGNTDKIPGTNDYKYEYEIVDIKEAFHRDLNGDKKSNSAFEPHYEMNIFKANT